MPDVQKLQRFPVYYTGSGEFKQDGDPSGLRGAVARVEINLNNRPHQVVGIRLRNTYPRFPTPTFLWQPPPTDAEPDVLPDPLPSGWGNVLSPTLPSASPVCCLLEALDDEQLIELELAQQNVIVRDIHQRELCGADGIHWHPFPCTYPFRGGNNLRIRAQRLQDYPHSTPGDPLVSVIKPVLHVAVLAWMFVSDEMAAKGPPSTDFDVQRS
jgi:hypothetical protein